MRLVLYHPPLLPQQVCFSCFPPIIASIFCALPFLPPPSVTSTMMFVTHPLPGLDSHYLWPATQAQPLRLRSISRAARHTVYQTPLLCLSVRATRQTQQHTTMIRNIVRSLGGRAGAASLRTAQVPSTARAAHGAALRPASVVGGAQAAQGQGLRRFGDSAAAEGGFGFGRDSMMFVCFLVLRESAAVLRERSTKESLSETRSSGGGVIYVDSCC